MGNDRVALDALIQPRRVAVIGASPRAGHFAHQPVANLRRYGFTGEIYPVNPTHAEVDGLLCYPSVASLPTVPDLAVIAVRPDLAVEAVADCAEAGVPAAIVVASGFAETGDLDGTNRQRDLMAVVSATGIRVCGPNTLGVANFNDNIVAFASANIPAEPVTGGIAIVSQSGGCGFTLLNRAWSLGVGVGHLAVAGNETDVTIADFVRYYLARDDVRTVVCYLEAIRDAEGLRAAGLLSAQVGKPVFVMKAGTTTQGQRAAAAHTGALATQDAVCGAAFRQWGLPRARTFDGLIAAGSLAARFEAPARGTVGVYAQGGGMAVVSADLFAAANLDLPSLTPETAARIKDLMPDTTPGNPFDSGGQFLSSGVDLLAAGLSAFAEDEELDVLVHCLMPVLGQRITVYAEGIARVARASTKPNVVLQYRAGALTERASEIFREAGLLAIDPPEAGVEGLALWLASRGKPQSSGTTAPRKRKPCAAARELVLDWRRTGHRVVGEHEAVALLELYDLPTARQVLIRDPAAAAAATSVLRGPYVVKVASPDLPHRSDVGGVIVGVTGTDAVVAAAERVIANARTARPDAVIVGATVAEMAPEGTELIAAARIDPTFGPVVMVGLGGVWTEMLHDMALSLAPIDHNIAVAMMRSLKGADVIFGGRGRPPVDVEAIAGVLVRLSELATDLADQVGAVEVNPLLAYSDGVRIVDALIELVPEAQPPGS